MLIRIFLVVVVLCAVFSLIECGRGYCANCRYVPYKRIKRGKYYSSPPKRFYSRPPVRFPYLDGPISYTPPPDFMGGDDQPYPGPPYPGPPSPYKVSKRPPNNGLGDDDLNNLMKHLTKQDLDKIIEFAQEKQREERPYPNALDNFNNEYRYPNKREEINLYKANEEDFGSFEQFEKVMSQQKEQIRFKENIRPVENEHKYTFNGPYTNQRPYDFIPNQNNPMEEQDYVVQPSKTYTINEDSQPLKDAFKDEDYLSVAKDIEQLNSYTNQVNEDGELLPRPLNMRPDDYDAMFSNNVPSVVKAEESSYQPENLGELPLMNYSSKLETVSSYHVPHYTITTPSRNQPASQSSSYSEPLSVPLEPAPPLSAAKEQSDAHLKAVKIWSHRSKGTAYTLHNDGTLSLEKPSPPKSYGHF